MGRWMEVVREYLPNIEANSDKPSQVPLRENGPHPLLNAIECLPHEARCEFPLLNRVRIDSGEYVNEELWLDAASAIQLLDELRRFRRICRYEEFIKGITARQLTERWLRGHEEQYFEEWLDGIESILQFAIDENCWVLFLI